LCIAIYGLSILIFDYSAVLTIDSRKYAVLAESEMCLCFILISTTTIFTPHALCSAQAMEPTDSDVSPPFRTETRFEQAQADFLLDKSKAGESGSYRRNLQREINRFREWFETKYETDVVFDAFDATVFRQYARHLCRQGWTDGTVITYYGQLSAFIGWCEREGYLETHHAQATKATEPLPDDDGRRSGDQQAWGSSQRQQIISHVDESAQEAVDAVEDGEGLWQAVQALRNRALVSFLCYTGIRAGEFLARSDDARRNGVTWDDLDLDDGRVTVLSKKQVWDDRSLPNQTIHPLKMLKQVMQPEDDWPVFVTLSFGDLFPPVREAMSESGLQESDIDEILDTDSVWRMYNEYDLTPSPLQTNGARAIMKRLTEAAGIEVGQGEYLQPHGGRRGAGEVMVRTNGYAAAARLLDNTEEMVRERYSHIEAGELADAAARAFEAVDSTKRQKPHSDTEDADIPDSYR
jgi:integrase